MVTTDKVTVTEFAPYIGKTTTDYKGNDMGVKATESRFNQTVQKDQATLIAELISRVTSLEKERTVEAIQIEIVRCKDCKYYRIKKISTGSEMPCCWQILGATPYREPEDFCSYGVRRTE